MSAGDIIVVGVGASFMVKFIHYLLLYDEANSFYPMMMFYEKRDDFWKRSM
jgi:hypothetical protein